MIWRGRVLLANDCYSSRRSGVDGMEIEAAAVTLESWLLKCRNAIDSVHFKCIHDIIQLARALPNCDPLVTYTSHTAMIERPLCQLIIDVAKDMDPSLRNRLARWARFDFQWTRGKYSLSQGQIQAVNTELQRLVVEMRAQRP